MLLGASDEALMESIADTILPETTASPGAKAAGCGAAINLLLTDCYDAAGQRRATAAIAAFRARAHTDFVAMSDADRTSLLRTINDESHTAGSGHWFHLLHELSTRTYFASEIGVTKALRYVREPGHFTGCVPITPGQPAWS